MKFTKTVAFDLYRIGDRMMEGVIYFVDLAITDDNKIICTGAVPDIDALPYLEAIGGPGVADHWAKQVLEHFSTEAECGEALGEEMSPDEWDEFEDILMGEVVEPVTVEKSAFMDMDDYNDLHFGKD